MDVNVDNASTLALEAIPADTPALVAALKEHLKKQGLVIKSLKVDGVDVFAREYDPAVPITETTSVEVTTENATEFATRILSELEEVLPDLPTACHSLAAVFQGNAPVEGFEPFQQLAEIWSVVKERQLEAAAALERACFTSCASSRSPPCACERKYWTGYLLRSRMVCLPNR